MVRYFQTPSPKYGQTPKDYGAHLNVGQDGLKVTELDWSGRLASSTRCRSWYWHSWGGASPDLCLGYISSWHPYTCDDCLTKLIPSLYNYSREFVKNRITLLTPQFLCETYFQRQQPWGNVIIVWQNVRRRKTFCSVSKIKREGKHWWWQWLGGLVSLTCNWSAGKYNAVWIFLIFLFSSRILPVASAQLAPLEVAPWPPARNNL